MGRLLARAANPAALTRPWGRCAQCGKPVRTRRYVIEIDTGGHLSVLHRRCTRPLRLSHRGQLVVDIAVALLLATLIAAVPLIGLITD